MNRSLTTLLVLSLLLGACAGTEESEDVTGQVSTSTVRPVEPAPTMLEERVPTAPTDVEPQTSPADAVPLPTGVDPVRITIPSIGVDATVIDLSLAGPEPEVPEDFSEVGWYTQTRLPGEIGPAVVAGHIDSRSGPAVFFRLDELVAGDRIEIGDADGATRVFVVTDSGSYPKDDLPPEVFGFGEPQPELRLLTCGGTFDSSTGHYRDNHVVYAELVGGLGAGRG